jgi:hypothetical protein
VEVIEEVLELRSWNAGIDVVPFRFVEALFASQSEPFR